MPAKMSEKASEGMPGRMLERASEDMPDRMLEGQVLGYILLRYKFGMMARGSWPFF